MITVGSRYSPTASCICTRAAERQLRVAVGFSPRITGGTKPRRGATLEPGVGCAINRSVVAPRLQTFFLSAFRGLKPSMCLPWSLADRTERGL